MSELPLIALGIAALAVAAILMRRPVAGRKSGWARSAADQVNPISQRARDYIASGAVPRWD